MAIHGKIPGELLDSFEGEGFKHGSNRLIEVRGNDNGVIIVSVTTRWGENRQQDTSLVALLPEELEHVNRVVNE